MNYDYTCNHNMIFGYLTSICVPGQNMKHVKKTNTKCKFYHLSKVIHLVKNNFIFALRKDVNILSNR